MKEIKTGWEGTADAMSFALIACANLFQIINKEHDPPRKFEYFYQKHEVINKAIELTCEKLQMVPNNERRTQTIILLHEAMKTQWQYIREKGDTEDAVD